MSKRDELFRERSDIALFVGTLAFLVWGIVSRDVLVVAVSAFYLGLNAVEAMCSLYSMVWRFRHEAEENAE